MRRFYLLFMLILAFSSKLIGNEEETVGKLREDWHQYLPTAVRSYPIPDSVQEYNVHPLIRVFQPENYKRIVIWITGNAFMFDEPISHDSLLRYFADSAKSKIFALSHHKIPEVTYEDIKNEIQSSIDFFNEGKLLEKEMPVILAGDSSGAFLATQLLPEIMNKISITELLFIAPIFDMGCFLDENFNLDSFPIEAQVEASNQLHLMRFISSLLFKHTPKAMPSWAVLEKFDLPKTHIIGFENDLFYYQAEQFRQTFNNVTLDCKKEGFHIDYLLKTSHEDISTQLFWQPWGTD